MSKKRVLCIYRVSTKGQVDKNDIPMQRIECHKFADSMGWEIVKELTEKGVSGFKVSAKDRDAIQEAQKAALAGEFDVLLVFMFDRLGRRDDETPFVVEWFIRNGIEVWSSEEGQQHLDTHTDKLLNYIRYWQASGESIKTSIRVKTRLAQIVQDGFFRGGVAPYGYRLEKHGRLGKKDKELYDIVIDEDESSDVRLIYDLADRFGYGGRRIASELAKRGVYNKRTGEKFHYSTIQNILRNIMYIGVLRSGEVQSEIIHDLQIIKQEQFYRVEKMRKDRTNKYYSQCGVDFDECMIGKKISYPRKIVGKALLSGNVYCGHCGGRIFATTGKKSHHPEYSERIAIYKCYNRTQHKELCNGPTTYRAKKVDDIIDAILRSLFERARAIDSDKIIRCQIATVIKENQRQIKSTKAELQSNLKEIQKWEGLMLSSIEGTCAFTPEQIRHRMETVQNNINALSSHLELLQKEAATSATTSSEIQEKLQQLKTWADVYDTASIDEKKMIASYLIKAVHISQGYEVDVELNISEEQFFGEMSM